MNELTDLQICKKIADIKGIKTITLQTDVGVWDYISIVSPLGHHDEFNPLTDDALCFQLMVNYNLSLIAPEREQEDWDCVIRDVLTVHKNPNKAICLAIIEAHKDQS